MLDAAAGLLRCPVCNAGLDLTSTGHPEVARGAGCPAGHRFDAARQGYLNLLGGPQPAHADTAPMVAARERVLASGAFDPVDTAVADILGAQGPPAVVVDAGGGTGHHLARLLDAMPDARGLTLDISVAAARRAAKAHPRAASVVADTWAGLPVRTGVADMVTCLFAPRNLAEFARVLVPGGRLVVVTPDAEHLASVRERHGLLGIEADKDDRLLRAASGHVDLVERRRVRAPLDASAELVADLIAMGPNAFHGVRETTGPLATEVAVSVWLFRTPGRTAP